MHQQTHGGSDSVLSKVLSRLSMQLNIKGTNNRLTLTVHDSNIFQFLVDGEDHFKGIANFLRTEDIKEERKL